MSEKAQPDRVGAFKYFCFAQMGALISGLSQIENPDRPFLMFLVALIGCTVLPVALAIRDLRPAWMSEPDRDGYPGLRS